MLLEDSETTSIVPQLLVFVEPENAGETTQIHLFVVWLRRYGYKVNIVDIEFNHLLAYLARAIIVSFPLF